jgi:hypothetical protein
MEYQLIDHADCSVCETSDVMLNEFGICASCMSDMSYPAIAKLTGDAKFIPPVQPPPVIERHESTVTVVQPTPRLRAMLACSIVVSAITCAAGLYLRSMIH